jgi:hypothetical protein
MLKELCSEVEEKKEADEVCSATDKYRKISGECNNLK